jgi:glycosyltransferase involved in cell wall biosynthesis
MPQVCILSSVHIALDNRVFFREARSLARNGFDVTLIAVHDRSEIRDGVQIIGLPQVPRWQRPRLWWRLFKLARQTQADLFLFHDPELLLLTPLLRWRTGRPTIYDVHEVYPDFIKVKDYLPAWLRYPIAWLFRWLEPLLARLQSGLIFADDEIARAFDSIDRPKTTLFNFPDMSLVEAGQTAGRAAAAAQPVVLYLGGMERNRGTALMMAAFARVLAELPQAELWLVGHFMPSDLEQEVRQDAAERGISEAITITGRVPFETIGDYLRQAAVGWVSWLPEPKNEKNIPTKLFEYMAYGLPVVSSDLASTRPFVHDGVNGYRVPAADPAAHAEAILSLLRQPAQAHQMGQAGQALVVSDFNWTRMEERLLSLVQSLLATKSDR